jgi:hypothetical protein
MQRKGSPRDTVKERFWRRAVRQQRRGGQSIRAYCRAAGLAEASFYAWRRELLRREQPSPAACWRRRQRLAARRGRRRKLPGSNRADARGRRPRPARPGREGAPAFLPVQVASPGVLSLGGSWIECLLPGGVVLRLPAETEPGRLARVIAACEHRHEALPEGNGRGAQRRRGLASKEWRRC